jgi:predicted Rossmann-fold nucleotide-binding protein
VPNEYITREIRTASLDERLATLVDVGQAYVVLPGGTGTLLELATVWELKNKKFLDPHQAIVLLGEFWKPLVALVAVDDPRSAERIAVVQEPGEVVACIREAWKG